MHGLYINPDDNTKKFIQDLINFAISIDYQNDKQHCKPFEKYIKLGFEKSIAYDYTINEIKTIKKLSFIQDNPPFTFRIAFTDNPNASNALWANKSNRATIIIKTDYNNLNKDIQILKTDKKIIGSLSHELVHAFDYSKVPKNQLDKNKSELYHTAKKEMHLGKEYTTCSKQLTNVITDCKDIIKFYYVCLYYTQQTEMNAYLRTFQNDIIQRIDNGDSKPKIMDIDIYKRYKFLNDFLNSYEKYDNKDIIIDFLKSSSYPTCYGKINKNINSNNLSVDEKLKKINFIINKNYIEYNIRRMEKIYFDIINGDLNEKILSHVVDFDTFLYNINEEIENEEVIS